MNKRDFFKNITVLGMLLILPTATLISKEEIRKITIFGKMVPDGATATEIFKLSKSFKYMKNVSMSHIKKDDVWYFADKFDHPYIATSNAYLDNNGIWGVDAIDWETNVAN